MNNTLLQIRNLSVGYGSKVVAGNLQADIPKGELICLLGSNGTGKSTLMRTLCGFQPALEGEVLLDNLAVHQMSEKQLSVRIAVVPYPLPSPGPSRAPDPDPFSGPGP